MPKPKAPKPSKEQIATRLQQEQKAKFFKELIRAKVFPVLQGAKTLIHAQQTCEIFKTVMTAQMNAYWADKKLSDLGLDEQLTKEGALQDVELYQGLIDALSDLKISEAHELLQGMGGAFDGYTRKLALEKPMSEIEVDQIINK